MSEVTEIVFTGVALLLGCVYALVACRLPVGTLDAPGPGFYPRLVAVLWIATSAVSFVWAVKGLRSHSVLRLPSRPRLLRALTVAGAVAGYALVFERLGFVLSLLLLSVAGARIFGYRRWSGALMYAIGAVAIVWLLFGVLLKVPLPQGVLG